MRAGWGRLCAAIVFAAALIATACGREKGGEEPALERLVMEPTLTIGSVDGPDALGEITSLIESPIGDVYLTQLADPTPRRHHSCRFPGGIPRADPLAGR